MGQKGPGAEFVLPDIECRFCFVDRVKHLSFRIDKGATGRGINPSTAGQDLVTKLNELGVKKKASK